MSSQTGLESLYVDGSEYDPSSSKKRVSQSTYYKNLQRELAQKKESHKEATTTQNSKASKQASEDTRHPKQNVSLLRKPSFKWSKDDSTWSVLPKQKKALPQVSQTYERSTDILVTFLGYKIDLSTQLSALMDKYAKVYVEARAHNPLLAKFAEIKSGMLQALLSLLGVSTDELQGVQKRAVKQAVEEQKVLFEQNEYNLEMIDLFGGSKKDKKRKEVLLEIREQLKKTLYHLGCDDAITQETIYLAKKKAVQQVLIEMNHEKQTLSMMLEFYQ